MTFNGSKAFLFGVRNAHITAKQTVFIKTVITCIFSRLPHVITYFKFYLS